MEPLEETAMNTVVACDQGGGGKCLRSAVVELQLPLGDFASTFDLEKAVCSHGLFMMAPNQWDPLSKTLRRPLRLNCYDDATDIPVSPSVDVRISQQSDTSHFLRIEVSDIDHLSPQQEQSLLAQVRRMLRLSEAEERNVVEFQEIYGKAKERGFGRVFRSPTLFEDMVKCILLCNCQWSRTLSMARALCELQLEIQYPSSSIPVIQSDSKSLIAEHFCPNTPAGKESKRKHQIHQKPKKLPESNDCAELRIHSAQTLDRTHEFPDPKILDQSHESYLCSRIGNFPSPRELARLDEKFLSKRCNLGYRASRVLSLARAVVEGRVSLRKLEEASSKPSLCSYNELVEELKQIYGFGPFTCANVLMCMGFYHVIPTDSETIRHLKQVHARDSTIRTVERDVELIYGKYSPFQFLAYWSEVWHFYEERFGKTSEMLSSDYKLITATNMRLKINNKNKRAKTS